ncbi:MAG TPA: M48 family metalloprotease [Candidatus Baltobacteraceae bacterium]
MILPLLVLGRPNALDHEVSALSVSALLHRSAGALVDPARAAAAAHLQQFRTPIWIVMIALQIGVLAWFWNAGLSAALRDRLRSVIRSEFGVRFCFGALLAGLDRLASLAPQAMEYRYMYILDLNNILLRSWLVEWIAATLLAMAIAGTIAAVVLWLADRTHQWYLYTIGAVMGFTLLISYANPYVIAPAYAPFTPMKSRLVSVPLLEEHIARRTHIGAAYVMGWGGSQRAVISDTLLAGATPAEIRFVLARASAWIDANDGLHIALVEGAFFVLGAALAVFISDRIGFRRDDDPVSRLALLGAVMGGVYLVALPFYNGYVRNVERVTDAQAVASAGDAAPAIRLQVREADQALRPLCPNPFAYWYFDANVPPGTRISDLQGVPDYCATSATQRR